VSFCIVTEVLASRLTRWQLVFEDFYGTPNNAIWLARGAPKRWFQAGEHFGVTNAPTRVGRLSFEVTGGVYKITVPKDATSELHWNLRWPTEIVDVHCDGCTVVEINAGGVATIVSTANAFTVTPVSADSEPWV